MKKIDRPLSPGESFGASLHNTLKKWGEEEKKINGRTSDVKNQLHLFTEEDDRKENDCDSLVLTIQHLHSLWHKSFIVEGYTSRIEADFARARGEEVLAHFFKWWSREERVVKGVEQSFKCELTGGEMLSGRLDRVEETPKGLRIIDFKSSQPRAQEEVDADLQLSMYALAATTTWHEPINELVLLFLNEEGVTERITHRNESQLHDAMKGIANITSRIMEKDFKPTPSFPVCNTCPYKGICDVAAA